MDKVKHYLELVRKHHFWLLCALAALVGLIVWQMSTGKLAAEFASGVQTIDKKFQSLQGSNEHHEDHGPGVSKLTEAVREDVNKTWDLLYQQQKEKVFVWPKELVPDFPQAIEKFDESKGKVEMDRDLLARYQRLVKDYAAKLPEKVDAASLTELGIDANVAANPGAIVPTTDTGEHKVRWNAGSLSDIVESFTWQVSPSTLLVKY